MTDVEEARKRWIEEQPAYERFGKLVADRIGAAVKAQGVWRETAYRPKETHSLVKKLLSKPKYTYETLPDKVGVRCVVRYLSDVDLVVPLVQQLFQCSPPDSKLEELSEDRVGYISIHIDVRLKPEDRDATEFPADKYWAEVQIRTQGQHLWAEMSHDTFYKNEETIAQQPNAVTLKRRVNIMSGLIEVADQEFNRLNEDITVDSATALYKDLERHYYRLTTKQPNTELSLEVINLLLPLYSGDIPEITQRIDRFVEAHESELSHVYETATDWDASAFLYQPEAIMLFERLEDNAFRLRQEWNRHFPERELERIANAFGISFD